MSTRIQAHKDGTYTVWRQGAETGGKKKLICDHVTRKEAMEALRAHLLPA